MLGVRYCLIINVKAVYNTESDGLVEIDHNMTVFNGQLNGVWNIIDGPFTPYVEGGIGWIHTQGSMASTQVSLSRFTFSSREFSKFRSEN